MSRKINSQKKSKQLSNLSSKNNDKKLIKKSKSRRTGFVFSICGPHGVGKTTVYNLLEKEFAENPSVRFYPERQSSNTPFPFGSKDKQIAFRSELHYQQQMLARNISVRDFILDGREKVAILDRSPICTLVYSRALELPDKDYHLIEDSYNSSIWVKEFIIYLEADPNTIMNRILQRGSLDKERLKWNEDDIVYLKKIIHHYNTIFEELHLKKKNCLARVSTDNFPPKVIAERILEIIEEKTGLTLKKTLKIPANQAKLTQWLKKTQKKVKT